MTYDFDRMEIVGETPKGVVLYGAVEDNSIHEIFNSNNSGQFEVLSCAICRRKKRYCKVRFLKTGNTQWCRKDRLRNGDLKDPDNWNCAASNIKDEKGKIYGRLRVVELAYRKRYNSGATSAFWKCRCECGEEIVTKGQSLRNGTSISCGCYQREVAKFINYRHGGYKTKEYTTYLSIKGRCFNKKDKAYPDYGGRGVTVDDRWLGEDGYNNFLEDMGKCPQGRYSIGRIDNDANYSPDNCRWESDEQQVNNRRRNKNNTSGRTGVQKDKKSGKWIAVASKGSKIKGDYKTYRLGLFDKYEDAVKCREENEINLYGRIKE